MGIWKQVERCRSFGMEVFSVWLSIRSIMEFGCVVVFGRWLEAVMRVRYFCCGFGVCYRFVIGFC